MNHIEPGRYKEGLLVATCSICGREETVCCDEGYTYINGGSVHINPKCKACCLHPWKPTDGLGGQQRGE